MLIRVIICLPLVLATATIARGQESTILSLEARATYLPTTSHDVRGDVDFNQTVGVGAAVMYGYRDRAIEFSIGRVSIDLDGEELDGSLVMLPVFLTGYFRFHPFGRRWFPFIGIGFGVLLNQYQPDVRKHREEDIADALGLQAVVGVEYFLWKKVSVAAQARYLYAGLDYRTVGNDGVSRVDRFALNTGMASFGIKRYF